MLKLAVVDANEKGSKEWYGLTASVVGGWLEWEFDRADVDLVPVDEADIVLLVFSGALDWRRTCHRALRKVGIETDVETRGHEPYVITGGPVDAIVMTALRTADCVAVGEAYRLVRMLIGRVRKGETLGQIRSWLIGYDHAIEREQVAGFERDADRPWLLRHDAPILATPDSWVDWSVPPVRSDDKVVRVIGSKGCHLKCSFCATTYRQEYSRNEDEGDVMRTLWSLKSQGERVQLVSNDPLNLPYFRKVGTRLDSQSFTIMEVRDRENRRAIIRSDVGIARFGVEGLSERIRTAFGKGVPDDELVQIIADFHNAGINTHAFLICGAPYESDDDWNDLKSLYQRIAETVDKGVHRAKLTTFVPAAPAPLSRFVPGARQIELAKEFRDWQNRNLAARHVFWIYGRQPKSHRHDVADQLGVDIELAEALIEEPETVDLAPTFDDFNRLPYQIIDWPIRREIRYRIGSVYRRRMVGDERPRAAVAAG